MDKNRIAFVSPQILSADHGGGIRVIEEARSLSIYEKKAVSIYTYNVSRAFDRMLPASVFVNRIWYTPKKLSAGPTLHRVYMDMQLSLKSLSCLQFKPNILHVHAHEGVPIGKLLSLFLHCPMVFDVQGSSVNEVAQGGLIKDYGSFYQLMCHIEYLIDRIPSVLVNSSPLITEFTIRRYNIDKHRVFTVLDAVDTSIIKPISQRDQHVKMLKKKLGIPEENIVVIYVGTFSKLQGIDILIHSMPYVVKTTPNVTFLLIGGKWNIQYHTSMLKLAQELNVKKNIRFILSADYFKELSDYLNLADIAVSSKLQSLQSNGKLAAYMAVGLPTVVFDIPINRIFLGELGIFQKNVSPESLAESIVFAIERYLDDVEFKQKLRLRAIELFSLKRLARDLQRVYNVALLQSPN